MSEGKTMQIYSSNNQPPQAMLKCASFPRFPRLERRSRKKRQTGVAPTSSKLQMCRSMDECLAHSCQPKERETHKGPLCSGLKTGQERELKIY